MQYSVSFCAGVYVVSVYWVVDVRGGGGLAGEYVYFEGGGGEDSGKNEIIFYTVFDCMFI